MKKQFFILSVAVAAMLLLFSCEDGKKYRTILQEAREQNQAYIPFTTDSVLREVVAYYDRHGTPNDRLLARYLLGCVYRDLHEAPIALITWEDAIACADTTAADCDYATLFRVYGQMAEVYFRQYMPEKELEASNAYCRYALLASDTLKYIKGLLQRNSAYLALGDTAAVYRNIKYVRQLYLEKGLKAEAAQVFPDAIQIALDQKQFERADSMMKVFESESGLFDNDGNIERTRELYYYDKGRYYFGIGKLDSAEYEFRRLLAYDAVVTDGYHALLTVFQHRACTDSILKYTYLYEQALAEYLQNTQIQSIAQAEGMYDYSRQERLAQDQEKKAHQFKLALISVLALGILIALSVLWIFQKRKEERYQLLSSYQLALEDLDTARKEIIQLQQSLTQKASTKKLIKEKEERIQQLEVVVQTLQKQIGKSVAIVHKQKLDESAIVKKFHSIARPHFETDGKERIKVDARAATHQEWEAMTETIQSCHPSLYLFLQKHKLSDLKFKVCILSYLGFDNPTIATLADANKGSIPNARTALAKELFNLKSAHELDGYLRKI